MRHFNRSSTYSTGLSQSNRQQSLPEIRQFVRSGETSGSNTAISKKTLHLPLDKSNSRFLKESVQNFLLLEEEEKYEEELKRLKLSTEVVESYCDQVCSGHVTSQEKLERIEQSIASVGQQATKLWKRLKKPLESPTSENSMGGTSNLNSEAIMTFSSILEDCSNLLGNYCSSLEQQGLLGTYKWSEPGEINAISPYLRAEELMSLVQSREYQVKFCHANITQAQKNGVSRQSGSNEAKDGSDGQRDSAVVSQGSIEDGDECIQALRRGSLMSKLLLFIGSIIIVLLIITVILIVALR